jgi:hypothetical protein
MFHSRAVAHRFAFSRSNKVSDEDTLREVPAAVPVSTAVKKLIGDSESRFGRM